MDVKEALKQVEAIKTLLGKDYHFGLNTLLLTEDQLRELCSAIKILSDNGDQGSADGLRKAFCLQLDVVREHELMNASRSYN